MTADGLAVQRSMQRLYFSYKADSNTYRIDHVIIPVGTTPIRTQFVELQNAEIRELAADNK